jgi:FkbM family methyltransferase
MNLISSAQNQEDIMLWRARHGIEEGFYIDVGAADPVIDSVTRVFDEHGWTGINLEPNPAYFERLKQDRARDINLPVGAGAAFGTTTFYVVGDSGLSTFNAGIAAQHGCDRAVTQRSADILPLAEICRRHRPEGQIHFLKIDAEGTEAAVLSGADFQAFRPWIVLVEATAPMSQEQTHTDWESILTGQGYGFVWFDGLNRFYLADEMKSQLEPFFQVQPNVFDDFAASGHLRQRADAAEQARAQASAEYEASARRADAILRQTLEAFARQTEVTAQAQEHCNTLLSQRAELNDTVARLSARAAAAEARLGSALSRAETADSWRQALIASTSWRLTAPLRKAVELLGRRKAPSRPLGTFRWRRMTSKDLARIGFRRAITGVLRLPGGRQIARLARALAPDSTEWLARRYRAYVGRGDAGIRRQSIPDRDRQYDAQGRPLHGLSAAERRVFHQITQYIPGAPVPTKN